MSKILDKIEKLLALAQSPNEHEAQAALEQAGMGGSSLLRWNGHRQV